MVPGALPGASYTLNLGVQMLLRIGRLKPGLLMGYGSGGPAYMVMAADLARSGFGRSAAV